MDKTKESIKRPVKINGYSNKTKAAKDLKRAKEAESRDRIYQGLTIEQKIERVLSRRGKSERERNKLNKVLEKTNKLKEKTNKTK